MSPLDMEGFQDSLHSCCGILPTFALQTHQQNAHCTCPDSQNTPVTWRDLGLWNILTCYKCIIRHDVRADEIHFNKHIICTLSLNLWWSELNAKSFFFQCCAYINMQFFLYFGTVNRKELCTTSCVRDHTSSQGIACNCRFSHKLTVVKSYCPVG